MQLAKGRSLPMGPRPHPAPLVRALGPGWIACAKVLPWQDLDEDLRYVVYSPAYCGTLFICRFQLFSPAHWWHDGHRMGIGGVTHWRLATAADQDFAELDGPLVVTGPRTVPWLRLRRWWSVCRYRERLQEVEP